MPKGQNKFQFTVDGTPYGTNDKAMDGGQIREAGGKTPASEFVLIEIIDGYARSVGLEEEVRFTNGQVAVFLSFRNDRVFTFTVDERGWEWGAATIAAADVYRYGGIDPDHELVLDSDADAVIAPDGEIDLTANGAERVRSRVPRTVKIKVNGRSREVEKRRHTYREIAAIAYPNPDFAQFNYTITYLHGVGGAEGDLVEGETIMVRNGMVFNVRRSDKS